MFNEVFKGIILEGCQENQKGMTFWGPLSGGSRTIKARYFNECHKRQFFNENN